MRSNNVKIVSCSVAVATIFLSGLSARSATLYGGVNHSDFLAPVDPVQSAAQQNPVPQATPQTIDPTLGASSASSATVQNPAIEWFPIPSWMAGKWSKKGDITESVTDLRTGITTPMNEFIEDYMTVTWGYQTDSQGLKLLEATPQNLATRTHYIVRETVGRELADIFQQESLTHYQLVGSNDQMDALSSNRVFSYQGQPKRDGKLISHYTKTSNFEPLPTKQGIDLAASLNQYLRTHNLAGLAKQVNAVNPNGIGNSFGNGMPGGISGGTVSGNRNPNMNANPTWNGRQQSPVQQIDPNNPF
ncbi:MAG: hypothetical protein HYX67_00275 [Candidatus Melainabacteria bacterium]|nr:hypothetical protein [Candidatus Melainabacteria bacterium]